MKKIIILCLLICMSLHFIGQNSNGWFVTIGGSSTDILNSSTIDVNGNIISVGTFSYSLYVNDSSNPLTSNFENSIFITKFSNEGNLLWQSAIGGDGKNQVKKVITDNEGNIFFGGNFESTLIVGEDTLTGINQNDNNKGNAFIISLNPDGNILWTKVLMSKNQSLLTEISFDKNNNLFISADYRGDSIKVDNINLVGTESPQGYYSSNCLLGKFNKNGNIIWLKTLTSAGNCNIGKIVIDDFGNIFIAGGIGKNNLYFNGIEYLGNDTTGSIFLSKLTSDGDLSWIEYGTTSFWSFISGMFLDSEGNIYLGGSYSLYLKFEGLELKTIGQGGPWNREDDIFIAKFDKTGAVIWAKTFGIVDDPDYIQSMSMVNDGELFITGFYRDSFYFDSLVIGSLHKDIYIAKFTSDGNLRQVYTTEAQNSFSFATSSSINIDNNGNVYIGGYFNYKTRFDNFISEVRGNYDAFLWRVDRTSISSINFHTVSQKLQKFTVFPVPANESLTICSEFNTDICKIQIFNLEGNLLLNLENNSNLNNVEIDLSKWPKGIYLYRIQDKNSFMETGKIILQ